MNWPEAIFAIVFMLILVGGERALGIVSEYKARTATTLWVPRLPPNVELGLKPDGTVVWRMVAPFQEDLDKPDTPSDTPRP